VLPAKILSAFFLALAIAAPAHAALFGKSRAKAEADQSPQTVTVDHGPFRIVAQGRRISSGAFPNQGGNPFATIEVTGFSVYHRDKPIVVRHGDRTIARFWRVATLADAPRPALLVSTTDFHLITEENGAAVVRSLGRPTTDMADYQWLDGPGGQPSPVASFGIEKVRLEELPLAGGRWLLLSAQSVLDVKSLRVYPVSFHVPQGQPLQGVGGTRALLLSPAQTQYVTYGSSVTLVENGEYVSGLSVVDIASGVAYGLPLKPGEKRFRDPEDLTPRWFGHYYEWRKDAAGRERLVPRDDVTPLPHAGRLEPHTIVVAGRDANSRYPTMTYVLRPATDGLVDALEQFVVARFGATRGPRANAYVREVLQLPQCPGGMEAKIYFGSDNEMRVVLEAVGSRYDDRAACAPAIEKVGRAFEDELARGRHQELFAR
jgi:hypothetical protein